MLTPPGAIRQGARAATTKPSLGPGTGYSPLEERARSIGDLGCDGHRVAESAAVGSLEASPGHSKRLQLRLPLAGLPASCVMRRPAWSRTRRAVATCEFGDELLDPCRSGAAAAATRPLRPGLIGGRWRARTADLLLVRVPGSLFSSRRRCAPSSPRRTRPAVTTCDSWIDSWMARAPVRFARPAAASGHRFLRARVGGLTLTLGAHNPWCGWPAISAQKELRRDATHGRSTSIGHVTPGASANWASAVRRILSSASASAT